ncbi:hypothetical protein BDZ97DRAFT_1793906 [Flammula alnicola]|nr:hypothetical protein BDZ97DRAFT_1892902 [Flammula alnicola]KAF8953160.1 hypothetical protein BDZ97DRAFT_1873668 [Flammula alnicola]KAF8954049.1 hypothetical protein BDZ97DRAFT_1868548 [Flammula alnicola]KAF8964356.1 hypothetical protein BDZ97DRAFT_1816077 [Flammula alnicola]KAF8969550.1 hypothetical protein BDZ97DRAFT_1793906 [Flammula alnicola]
MTREPASSKSPMRRHPNVETACRVPKASRTSCCCRETRHGRQLKGPKSQEPPTCGHNVRVRLAP